MTSSCSNLIFPFLLLLLLLLMVLLLKLLMVMKLVSLMRRLDTEWMNLSPLVLVGKSVAEKEEESFLKKSDC
jgi:hypothetical protein